MNLQMNRPVISVCILLSACDPIQVTNTPMATFKPDKEITTENIVGDIKTPDGYEKWATAANSFHAYLRGIRLKKDKTVYLYDGTKKNNQSAQYAVLNVSVGTKDLQQCADAVMRLRAEYFYNLGKFNSIEFYNGRREKIHYINWLAGRQNSRQEFMKYMEHAFNYCGTASLPYSVKNKPVLRMVSGDIFLKPGSPGHTVIVMDMATNAKGKKIYLLAQSYMPAQDIHILKNPANSNLSPWYELNDDEVIDTPEWRFYSNQLYGWK